MNKKIIISIIVIMLVGGAVLFLLVGNSDKKFQNSALTATGENQLDQGRLFANAIEVALGDLKIGDLITVIGTANDDGSVTAQSMFIGDVSFDPEQFRGDGLTSTDQGDQVAGLENRQLPEGFNPQEFQNLTPEERQARFQKLQVSGELPNRSFAGSSQSSGLGATVILGKILAVDEAIITVEIPEGGSKLVIYSSGTPVSKVVDSTSTKIGQ